MNIERLKVTAETTGVRARTWMKHSVRLAGLVAVIVGAINLFAPYLEAVPAVGLGLYAIMGGVVATGPLGHVVLMAIGAAVAWFV